MRFATFDSPLLKKAGIDRAVFYGVLTRVWGLASGGITILATARLISPRTQGFYYTISSILTVQIFFELGLTNVISIFASHEFAKLKWLPRGNFIGDKTARQRLVDILAKSSLWFAIAALLLVAILVPAGLYFLGLRSNELLGTPWIIPWVLAVIGTASFLMATPFFAVIIGSGDVAEANSRWFWGSVVGYVTCWIILLDHGALYAVCAISFGNAVVSWLYLIRHKPEMIRIAWRHIRRRSRSRTAAGISWRKDIWPMQWKIAVSWISGFFIFKLFTPVLFYYHGAVAAGQMGITLAANNALLGIGITWVSVRTPEMARLVAGRQWKELDRVFRAAMLQSLVVTGLGALAGYLSICYVDRHFPDFGARLLPPGSAACVFASAVATVAVDNLATYLRNHKEEPLMMMSITAALIQGTTTWYFGWKFSSAGICIAFLCTSILYPLPAAWYLFRRYRALWHGEIDRTEVMEVTA